MAGVRFGVGAACVAVALSGCAAPEQAPGEPATRASTEATDNHGHRDRPSRGAGASTETGDHRGHRDRPARRDGARAKVPTAVILQQLRRAVERIARNYTAPPTPTPVGIDPGTNRALGYQLMLDFGFAAEQWPYLDALWQRESGWNHLAENPRSGAYGIPQSLPARKMAVVGDDWRTNPDTQIRWGLAYIAARYGSPQRAWEHSQRLGWY